MTRTPRRRMTVIHKLDEIPAFANEDEEHEFWSTHSLGDEIWDAAEPLPEGYLPPVRPRPPLVTIKLTLSEEIVERAKTIADQRHVPYKILLQRIVRQGLDAAEGREEPVAARRQA